MKVFKTVVLHHCSPAPPHPAPGTVSNAICPPTWGDAASVVFAAIVVVVCVWSMQYLPGHIGGRAR